MALPHLFSHRSAMWVAVWVWFFIAPNAQNLRRCKQDRGTLLTGSETFSRCWSSGAKPPIVAACEELCEALTEGAASGDAGEVAGHVRPVWAEVGENVLREYLQRENSMRSGTTTAVLGVNPAISVDRKKY
jgi:hypothetical protein